MRTVLFLLVFAISSSMMAQYVVSDFSGSGAAGYSNGSPASSQYSQPWGMCRDNSGSIYLADNINNCIRLLDPQGNSSNFAGSTTLGFLDGPVASAMFRHPTNVCFDNSGNLIVADFENQRIRLISGGMVTTIAGSGVAGYLDGPDSIAQFNYPRGICVDSQGNIYVADSWNHRIRKIDGQTHEVTTYAGGGTTIGVQSVGDYVDASDTSARFYVPCGLTIGPDGELYITDTGNHRIRKIDSTRNVTTLAGSGPSLPNAGSFVDGPALSAGFAQPTDIFRLPNGDLLISDTYNNSVRLFATNDTVTTIAGDGTAGYQNGPGLIAKFNSTRGVVANDAGDSIYVAERMNHMIRLIYKSTATGFLSGFSENIIVYPNPTNGRLSIEIPEGLLGSAYSVLNITGQVVMEGILDENRKILDLGPMTSGMYFLRVEKTGYVKKIQKR